MTNFNLLQPFWSDRLQTLVLIDCTFKDEIYERDITWISRLRSLAIEGHFYLIHIPTSLLLNATNITDLTLIDVILSNDFVNSNIQMKVSVLNYGMTNDFIRHSRQLNFLIKASPMLDQLILQTDEWDYRPPSPINYKWQFIDGLPDNIQFETNYDICLYNTLK